MKAQPEPMTFYAAGEVCVEISQYVQELCLAAKLDTRFVRKEDEVVIQTGQD